MPAERNKLKNNTLRIPIAIGTALNSAQLCEKNKQQQQQQQQQTQRFSAPSSHWSLS
jgi:hypothetical protein